VGSKTKELMQIIEEIIQLLAEDDNQQWQGLMKSVYKRLENSDYSGIELLLSVYGGMGSFNDLIIGQTNDEQGKFAWKVGAIENNNRLDDLRGRAYVVADYLKRNHQIVKES
jgi:hypothetical protein